MMAPATDAAPTMPSATSAFYPVDKKSRQLDDVERVLIEKVDKLFGTRSSEEEKTTPVLAASQRTASS